MPAATHGQIDYQFRIVVHQTQDFIEKDRCMRRIIQNPLREEMQPDGRIRRWARISEMENRALRVILLDDGETVHNAFFDRDFKE